MIDEEALKKLRSALSFAEDGVNYFIGYAMVDNFLGLEPGQTSRIAPQLIGDPGFWAEMKEQGFDWRKEGSPRRSPAVRMRSFGD